MKIHRDTHYDRVSDSIAVILKRNMHDQYDDELGRDIVGQIVEAVYDYFGPLTCAVPFSIVGKAKLKAKKLKAKAQDRAQEIISMAAAHAAQIGIAAKEHADRFVQDAAQQAISDAANREAATREDNAEVESLKEQIEYLTKRRDDLKREIASLMRERRERRSPTDSDT